MIRITLAALASVVAAPAIAQPPAMPGLALSGTLQQGNLVRGTAPAGAVALSLNGNPIPLAADRRFVIGLDRDAEVASIEVRFADGSTRRTSFGIAARPWSIQNVDVARNLPREGDESYARREAEVLRMNAARASVTGAEGWRQDFVWPARGRISGRFGSQRVYRGERGSYHAGVDVAAGTGATVVAPADGVVVIAPPPSFSFEGNLVIIDHGGGLSSAFLHLSRADVRVGQRVAQGEAIGAVGATGRASGPHLHWALVASGVRVDPEPFVGPQR